MLETTHWLIEFTNEWRQLFGKYNWYTITFIEIYFEKDDFTHGYEFVCVILGLGVRVRYNTDKALAQLEEWQKDVENSKLDS
jgi:hypothetical protein